MKNKNINTDKDATNNELIEAIKDLTRVLIITNQEDTSKSEIVRKLNDFSVSPTRIAKLLGMKPKDVTSIISKGRKIKKPETIVEENTPVDE